MCLCLNLQPCAFQSWIRCLKPRQIYYGSIPCGLARMVYCVAVLPSPRASCSSNKSVVAAVHLPEIMLLSMNGSILECRAGHWQAYLDPRLHCGWLHVYTRTTIQQRHVSGVVLCLQFRGINHIWFISTFDLGPQNCHSFLSSLHPSALGCLLPADLQACKT